MSKIIKNKKLYYLIIFAILFILCYLFPYSHDDWAWGSLIGIERLESHFANYNGRWLGNFVVLALTRSSLLKTIVMSLSLVLILYFINEITNKKNKTIILLSFLLLLATPYLVLKEAIAWTSGFANYVVPVVLILIFIYLNSELFNRESKDNWKKRMIMLILGFASTLFVEHVTLYVIALAVFSVIYSFIRYKKVNYSLIYFLIGSILGSIVMFSNGAYSNISSGKDNYRTIGIANFVTNSFKSYFNTIYKHFIFNNGLLNIILSSLVLKVLYDYLIKEKKHTKLIYAIALVITMFPIYTLLIRFSGVNLLLKYTKYINGLFSILYYLCILISSFFIKEKESRNKIIFALASIIILILPLFVVTPIGGRCFFPIYALWIWITLEFYQNTIKKENVFLKVIIISAISIFTIYLLSIYGYIFKVDYERINFIEKNSNAEVIYLPKLPYQKYIWHGDPANDVFTERFKMFYGIRKDTDVEFVSYKKWKQMNKI